MQKIRGKLLVGKKLAAQPNTIIKDLGTGHATITLTAEELSNDIIFLTGEADAGYNVVFNKSITKLYTVNNASGQTATLKNAAGNTVTVANGATAVVFNDGTNIVLIADKTIVATLAGTEVLTNKTLTSPVINGALFGSSSEVAKDIGEAHADITLTATELLADVVKLSGTGDAGFNLILNATVKKTYLIDNQSGQTVTVKNAEGTTVEIATTKRAIVWNNGTNVVRITADA